MLPIEHLRWMVDQPETVLCARLPQAGRFAIDYLSPGMDYNHDLFLMDVIRKDLTRNLGRLQPGIYHDIRESIDELMGLEIDGWREFCLWTPCRKRYSNRHIGFLLACHFVRMKVTSARRPLLPSG